MTKAIALLKFSLLYMKYQNNFHAAEWNQIRKLAELVALIYGRSLLQSAPRLDLQFLTDLRLYRVSKMYITTLILCSCIMFYGALSMCNTPFPNLISFPFQQINPAISNAAKDSILNHLWCLCLELVIMTLFDKDVSIAEKTAIAQALLQHPAPAHFARKPGGRKF